MRILTKRRNPAEIDLAGDDRARPRRPRLTALTLRPLRHIKPGRLVRLHPTDPKVTAGRDPERVIERHLDRRPLLLMLRRTRKHNHRPTSNHRNQRRYETPDHFGPCAPVARSLLRQASAFWSACE